MRVVSDNSDGGIRSSPSGQRRRTRAEPVASGTGGEVLTWIDVFG